MAGYGEYLLSEKKNRSIASAGQDSQRRGVGLARVLKDRYLVVGLATLVVFFSCVTLAVGVFGNTHGTNGVGHGISNVLAGHEYQPLGWTDPPGSQYSTAEVRHYFDDGTYNVQCASSNYGYTQCGAPGAARRVRSATSVGRQA
jgi:hypothetical protein